MLLVMTVIVCSVMLFWIAEGGWRTWKSLRLLLGTRTQEPEDVSRQRPSFPNVLDPEVDELKAEGFRRLGETQMRPPQFREPLTTWVFIEASRTIAAELTWGRSRWHLNSYFGDGAWLVTDFPRGESNQAPGFRAGTIRGSLTQAIEFHRRQVEAFTREHGPAVQLKRFADYLAHQRAAQVAHGLTRVARVLRLQGVRAVAVVYALGVLLFAAVAQRWAGLTADAALPLLTRLGLWLAPAFIVMAVTDWLASRHSSAAAG